MTTADRLVLTRVLGALRPLVRLLVRHGVGYPAFAAALKQTFVDVARQELATRGMPATDSAVTLLSGVHRRDVREMGKRPARAISSGPPVPASLAGEVVGRWMADAQWHDARGAPRRLLRGPGPESFDALVASISRDVRPRALLDELLRLGAVQADEAGITLVAGGFAPRQGLAEMLELLAANAHDHLAAAVANVEHEGNFLEQAVYVDEIGEPSVDVLRRAAAAAWQQAFATVMAAARQRFDADARELPAEARRQRARFGVYFFSDRDDPR
jgi:hypothetical protein